MLVSRLIAASAYAGAAFFFGLVLGERGELGLVQHIFTAVIPLAAIVLAVYARRRRAAVITTGLAMLAGLLLGQHQFQRGWIECVGSGNRVRVTLEQHHLKAGSYPSRIESLDGPLPCRAGLRRTILHYMSNGQNYRLWFADDRETWIATDRHPFTSSEKSVARPGS